LLIVPRDAIPVLGLILVGTEALEFPEGPYKALFSSVVNGTYTWSPVVTGYGVDRFPQMTVNVYRDIYNWSGNAVLMAEFNKGKSPEKSIRKMLKDGEAKGYAPPKMIMLWGGLISAGFGQYSRDFSDVSDIKIPVVEVSLYFYALVTLLNNQTAHSPTGVLPITVIVRDDDKDPMILQWSYAVSVICAIIMTSLCVACFSVNIYKFFLHLRYTSGITTSKIYFAIDFVANVFRFWYVCINPFYLNKFNFTFTTLCTTTHMALTIVCTLLISLKWQELLRRTKLHATMFLSAYKWPFIVAASIIFIVELVSGALRGHWYAPGKLPLVSWSFLTVVGFIVTTLLFVSGIQILIQIRKAVGASRRIWQLNTTTILILASGLFLLAWSITEMAYLIKSFRLAKINLKQLNAITTVQFIFLFGCSFLQSWAMPIPGGFGSRSSGGTEGSRPTNYISSKGEHVSSKVSSKDIITKEDRDALPGEDRTPTEDDTSETSSVENPSANDANGEDEELEDLGGEMEEDEESSLSSSQV
jgi:hypothetical protein